MRLDERELLRDERDLLREDERPKPLNPPLEPPLDPPKELHDPPELRLEPLLRRRVERHLRGLPS